MHCLTSKNPFPKHKLKHDNPTLPKPSTWRAKLLPRRVDQGHLMLARAMWNPLRILICPIDPCVLEAILHSIAIGHEGNPPTDRQCCSNGSHDESSEQGIGSPSYARTWCEHSSAWHPWAAWAKGRIQSKPDALTNFSVWLHSQQYMPSTGKVVLNSWKLWAKGEMVNVLKTPHHTTQNGSKLWLHFPSGDL